MHTSFPTHRMLYVHVYVYVYNSGADHLLLNNHFDVLFPWEDFFFYPQYLFIACSSLSMLEAS